MGKECASTFHNNNGYLSVEYPYTTKLSNAFIKAGEFNKKLIKSVNGSKHFLSSSVIGEELGYRKVDYNTPDYMGFSKLQATMQRGTRQSVYSAFLRPTENRPNLEIIPFARATKVLINATTREAYGIEFFKKKVKHVIYAEKEVILSAGTFHSPQLLMLSGIGPREHLEELGEYNVRVFNVSNIISCYYNILNS